jgi:uncharacterized protein YutE (UPF0331/DUF86 family)
MSAIPLQRLADELTIQLGELLQLKAELLDAQARIGLHEPDSFELRALGSMLHDLYNGVEGMCNRIAKEIDRHVPTGGNRHRDLLDQMKVPLPGAGPAVFQTETAELLEQYRRFRHIVRHIYGFKLDWSQVQPLNGSAVRAIDLCTADIEQFIAFLRMMVSGSAADNSSEC